MESYFCCPHCGNKNVQATTETNTTTTGSNFSAGKGCLGYLLFGPLGILCGSCGSNKKTVTTNTTQWHCSNCGKKFRNPEEIIKENENMIRGAEITFAILGTIFTIVMISVFHEELLLGLFFALICCAVFGACCYGMKKSGDKAIEAAYEQQKAMKKFMQENKDTTISTNSSTDVISEPTYSAPVIINSDSTTTSTSESTFQSDTKNTVQPANNSKPPVRIYPNDEGYIFCPLCGTKQYATRKICYRCEVPFISEDKAPSYRCATCGFNEEFGEFCPNCGSNSKILNIRK